jgi:hypothetical protein
MKDETEGPIADCGANAASAERRHVPPRMNADAATAAELAGERRVRPVAEPHVDFDDVRELGGGHGGPTHDRTRRKVEEVRIVAGVVC